MIAGLPWWTVVIAVCLCVVPARTPWLGVSVGIGMLVTGGVILAAAGSFADHWLSHERWIGYQAAGYGAAWIAIAAISARSRRGPDAVPRARLRRKA